MIYKPENTVDLDTGAILKAEVRLGDEADQKDLAAHVLEAQEHINAVKDLPVGTLTIESATADKGYHAVPELGALQQEGIRTVISDPVVNRNREKLTTERMRRWCAEPNGAPKASRARHCCGEGECTSKEPLRMRWTLAGRGERLCGDWSTSTSDSSLPPPFTICRN